MKRMTLVCIVSAALAPAIAARATDVSGDQWGTWTLAASPYHLVGDVTVPPTQVLVIEPGVEVIAQGHYRITVDAARLTAVGTEQAPILFTAADTNTGWRGLRLENADDESRISHCLIEYAKGEGAYPDVRGGAIMIRNCSPIISHNLLQHNYSHNGNYNGTGGGICTETSSATITDNVIVNNTADSGGGICITEYGTPIVRDNFIADNTGLYAGGGLYFGARSSPLVANNIIIRNQCNAGWGGGGINSWTSFVFYGTCATVRNNLIAHNSANDGGGIYCRYDKVVLTNNLLAHNSATGAGGGIYALNYPDQAPQVDNCILWGNTAPNGAQIYVYPDTGSAIHVNYCDVQGSWPGTGNMSGDPAFIDPDGEDDILGTDDDNFRLAAGSMCIDAGNNNALPSAETIDLDGNPRFVDDPDTPDTGIGAPPIVDLGPYEFQPSVFGDLNGDNVVDVLDLLMLLSAWDCTGGCEADLNGDGIVDVLDLLLLLGAWS